MRIWLQLVALSIVTLLAIPPAMAELCLAPQAPQTECCADSVSSAMRSASQSIVIGNSVAQAKTCDEGCCSVSPQSAPVPSSPEKAATAGSSLGQDSPLMGLVVAPDLPLWHDSQAVAVAIDLQILLRIFRI